MKYTIPQKFDLIPYDYDLSQRWRVEWYKPYKNGLVSKRIVKYGNINKDTIVQQRMRNIDELLQSLNLLSPTKIKQNILEEAIEITTINWRPKTISAYKTLILTKRIQPHLDCEDKDQRDAYMQALYSWQRICFQSANLICSHLFVQDRIKVFFYLAEDIQYKLTDRKKDPMGLFSTSGMNTVYALIASHFKGQIPMHLYRR
ncbi:hypothetical protein ACTJIJ_21900 [Niabella sp. 22666]|uniref:hypothetical protein n=1 Tax=Niabella sp. 22666 TaxID=3453954 RepID=UPI003F86D94E